MFSTIRSVSVQAKPAVSSLFTPSNTFPGKVSPIIGTVRSHQASAGAGSGTGISNQPKPTNMEKIQHVQESAKKGDVMSHSFGEGYATRSDEEGFGGTYGGNQSLSGKDEEKIVHANPPVVTTLMYNGFCEFLSEEYDKTQGSESAQKEQGRNQTRPNN